MKNVKCASCGSKLDPIAILEIAHTSGSPDNAQCDGEKNGALCGNYFASAGLVYFDSMKFEEEVIDESSGDFHKG